MTLVFYQPFATLWVWVIRLNCNWVDTCEILNGAGNLKNLRMLRTICSVVVFLMGSVASMAAKDLEPADFVGLREVSDPQLSPDGGWLVYTVKTADLEKDKRPTNLWACCWDGSESHALTSGIKNQSHPRWSPDGKWIAFLSARDDDNEKDAGLAFAV